MWRIYDFWSQTRGSKRNQKILSRTISSFNNHSYVFRRSVWLADSLIDDYSVAVIFGYNIFEDNVKADIISFTSGAKIFLKEVIDAPRDPVR